MIWVKKTVHGLETRGISCKENVPGAPVSKKGDTGSILGHKRTQHYLKSYNCK